MDKNRNVAKAKKGICFSSFVLIVCKQSLAVTWVDEFNALPGSKFARVWILYAVCYHLKS